MTAFPYRPEILRLGAGASLLDSIRDVTVYDEIGGQLRDLIRTRHPQRRLASHELDQALNRHLAGRDLRTYGAWVYYPWSRRLVHLLDEAEFAELRTNRNRNKITVEEQALLGKKRIGIVGLSVGQATAIALALERAFGEIRLADFDHLDLSNLNRLRTGVHNLGIPKVYQAAREIAEIDPYLHVRCFPAGLTGGDYSEFLTDGGTLDLVIEECDSIDVKVRVRQQAKRFGIPVVMDTGDRGMIDVERFDIEPERRIFHGLLGDIDPARLTGLTTEEKLPYVLRIIGRDTMSPRLRASLMEIESTLTSWPQLASGVHLGAALACDVSRRILLGSCRLSGRFYADLNAIVPDEVARPEPSVEIDLKPTRLTAARMKRLASRVPGTGTRSRVPIERLVADAIRAPSGGNSQPWRWYWDGRLHLFLDRARAHSLLDYNYYGAYAALGAASENLRISSLEHGIETSECLFPLGEASELTSVFTLTSSSKAKRDPLYESICRRHTNRRLDGRQPLLDGELDRLRTIAESAGARIHWLSSAIDLEAAGRILGEGDRLRFQHRELHRQLMSELRFEEDNAGDSDGISVGTLELSASDRAGLELSRSYDALSLMRSWGGGGNLAKAARNAVASSSAVGLLSMPEISPVCFLRGGAAAQRVWLTATSMGIAFHPMTALPYLFARLNQGGAEGLDDLLIDSLEALRPQYEQLFAIEGQPAEVMLFRLAIADTPAERSARRPVSDCLCTEERH